MKRLSIALFLFAACSKSSGDAPSSAKAAEAKPVAITALGLTANVAGDADISELMGDQMVRAANLVVTVGPASTPKDLAAAKEDAGMYSPKNVKAEELADGYVLTYENTGAAGANYFVVSQRTIGGKAYKCSTTSSSSEQQSNAVAFCKSLKAQ